MINSRKYIFIIVMTLFLLLIIFYFLIAPNAVIFNPSKYDIAINNKNIGNSEKIFKHLNYGDHIIVSSYSGRSSMIKIKSNLFFNKINVPKIYNEPKSKIYSGLSLPQNILSPYIENGHFYYIGGRMSDYLISQELPYGEKIIQTGPIFRGAKKVVWNKNHENAIITVSIFDKESQKEKEALYLFDKKKKVLELLNFISADWYNDDTIIGLKNGEVFLIRDGVEKKINLKLKEIKKITTKDGIIIGWNDQFILINNKNKIQKYKIPLIIDASISSNNNSVLIIKRLENSNYNEIYMIDIKNKKFFKWPIVALQKSNYGWIKNSFYVIDKSNYIWQIDAEKKIANTLIKLPELTYQIFPINNSIYARISDSIYEYKILK